VSTTKQFLIEQHYESLAEDLHWDTNRLHRLCSHLRLSVSEMAAYIRVRPSMMKDWVDRNRFPDTVELHLTLIERAAFPNAKPPVFPAL
jgi:DNA-binding transcriptional regulator YiaG